MLGPVSDLFNTLPSVVELVGKAVQVAGDLTESETLQDIGKMIQDNAETLAK